MVSDFIVEGHGYLGDDQGTARLLLEIQHNGYFNSERFLPHVDNAIDIFERKYPHAQGIFLFDNAPCHKKVSDDALNPQHMNVSDGGKQPFMRSSVWNGQVQHMVMPDGRQKGMKRVLEERNVDVKGMNAAKMRETLAAFPDFAEQKTLLEEQVQSRGHICIFIPNITAN